MRGEHVAKRAVGRQFVDVDYRRHGQGDSTADASQPAGGGHRREQHRTVQPVVGPGVDVAEVVLEVGQLDRRVRRCLAAVVVVAADDVVGPGPEHSDRHVGRGEAVPQQRVVLADPVAAAGDSDRIAGDGANRDGPADRCPEVVAGDDCAVRVDLQLRAVRLQEGQIANRRLPRPGLEHDRRIEPLPVDDDIVAGLVGAEVAAVDLDPGVDLQRAGQAEVEQSVGRHVAGAEVEADPQRLPGGEVVLGGDGDRFPKRDRPVGPLVDRQIGRRPEDEPIDDIGRGGDPDVRLGQFVVDDQHRASVDAGPAAGWVGSLVAVVLGIELKVVARVRGMN